MRYALEEEILAIIKEKNPDENIGANDSLLQTGVVSSLQLIELLFELESKYGVKFNLNEIDLNSIDSAAKLSEFINGLNNMDNLSLRDVLIRICTEKSSSNAVIFDELRLTYDQLYANLRCIVMNMYSYGMKKGSKVAIIADNRIEYIYSYFALAIIGAWSVPLNTRWSKEESFKILDSADVDYFICSKTAGSNRYGEFVAEYITDKKNVINVFYLDENLYGDRGVSFSSLLDGFEGEFIIKEDIAPEDIAMISYTSGTTGLPKGVLLKHNDLVKISMISAAYWWTENNDCCMSIAPLYAAQGFLSLYLNFCSERCFKMLSSFNPNDILKETSKGDNTMLHTQPTMWTMLLNCRIIEFTNFDIINKVIVSGSVCSPELGRRIEERLDCKLLNAYGLIEGTSVVTMTHLDDPEDVRLNTVGRPIPGVEIKIVDENRKELPKGETGELAIRGYNMVGYYKRPEKTQEVLDEEGWLYTGDLARYYDDVNISIVGRCKDMIIRGGFNVYPTDIEDCILQMPEVQTAAVVGKPHEVLGEEIIAFVVPKAGVELDSKKVSQFIFRKIANYKFPDKIYLISEMPIVLAGKIDKKVLNNWVMEGIPQEKQIFFEK